MELYATYINTQTKHLYAFCTTEDEIGNWQFIIETVCKPALHQGDQNMKDPHDIGLQINRFSQL